MGYDFAGDAKYQAGHSAPERATVALSRQHIETWMNQFETLASDTSRKARFEITPNGLCRVHLHDKLAYEGSNIDKAIKVYNRKEVNANV